MIWTKFTEDAPRLGLEAVGEILSGDEADALLDIDVEIDDAVIRRRVALTTTDQPRGGRRRWWVCPRCGRRTGHLYLVGDVTCRRCAGLSYASEFRR